MDHERITVGIDDSSGSRAALRWTAERAAGRPVSVRLVHVLERGGPHRQPAESVLDDARAVLIAAAPGSEVDSALRTGDVATCLVDAAATDDLLVIGAHRGRILRSALRGWLPERIATRASVPTVIVADDWERHDGPVLVGIAAGPHDAAVDFAAAEAVRAGRHLDLVGTWRLPVPVGGARPITLVEDPRLFEDSAETDVVGALLRARAGSPSVAATAVVVDGRAADVLAERSRTASLVVIGRDHRTTLGGALFGSTARGLLHHTRTPVCVVPTARAALAR